MNNNRSKNILIGALALAIIIMSAAYALLATNLTINASGKIDAQWDIHFEDNVVTSFAGTASNAVDGEGVEIVPTASGTTASFNVDLKAPGDKATYTLTITNAGTISAQLKDITDLSENNAAAPTEIIYTISGVTVGEALVAGASKNVTVTVEWPDSDTVPTGPVEKAIAIVLQYEQA